MTLFHILGFIVAACLGLLVLWEIFETIVLPRKIDRKLRVTRFYYLAAWRVYGRFADPISKPKRRAAFLSIFGPLSLLGLFVVWGVSLAFAFALINWSTYSAFKPPDREALGFLTYLYVSGTTINTLGLGDVTPLSPIARLTTVIEGGLGLGLVALVIGYLPTLYQAFSRREIEISLLDARAGSPPSATELLHRSARHGRPEGLEKLLGDWERWCAEIMESHISYPVLCYFRSQHTNQSWLASITAILDTCALCLCCLDHESNSQAHLTFAIARHAVVDITQVFHQKPTTDMPDRLSHENLLTIKEYLYRDNLQVCGDNIAWSKLVEMRRLYEPYLFTLSRQLRMELAPWSHPEGVKDNWFATRWQGHGDGSKR